MSVQNRPSYPHENISSLRALAAHLRIELDELLYVASNVEKFYRPGPPQEKNMAEFAKPMMQHLG